MLLLMIFLWGAIGAVAYSDLLPFWMLIVGGVIISIVIIGMSLFASNNKSGTTATADTSGSDDSSGDSATASVPTIPANSSPTSWGGVVMGLILGAILIGVFVWAPWKSSDNFISSAVSKVDREMMAQGYVEVSYSSIGGDLYVIHWEKLPDFHGGDTIDFYNVEFDGNKIKKWGFKTNSFTPKIVKKGTTLHLADGEKMPKKLYAKIIKKIRR